MSRHNVFIDNLTLLNNIANKFGQESEDLIQAFYIKWMSSKSDKYQQSPRNYIARAFRNFYKTYFYYREVLIPVESIEKTIKKRSLSSEILYQHKEVVSVYKSVGLKILPKKRHEMFLTFIDSAIEDPFTTRISVANKLNLSLNNVKTAMVEIRKALTRSSFKDKVKQQGYGGYSHKPHG